MTKKEIDNIRAFGEHICTRLNEHMLEDTPENLAQRFELQQVLNAMLQYELISEFEIQEKFSPEAQQATEEKARIRAFGNYLTRRWNHYLDDSDDWKNLQIKQEIHDALRCMQHHQLITNYDLSKGVTI